MYDPLTSAYVLPCPGLGRVRAPLSAFRALELLPGAFHPAVYQVWFSCPCGEEHPALVSHDDLDWAPLGAGAQGTFRNLMTRRDDALAHELTELAATRIRVGEWPWSFYCYLEGRARPVTPSAFAAIAPSDGSFGVAVRCPVCTSLSVNIVSRDHLDVPFWNDASVGVVDHVLRADGIEAVEELRTELRSARFDERRIHLEP